MSHITVISGPKTPGSRQDFELRAAKRALRLLKARLGKEGMLNLLRDDLDGTDQWIRTQASNHNHHNHDGGSYLRASATLHIKGLSVQDFLTWFFANSSRLAVMQAAHPEHYINEGYALVVETIGGRPTHLSLRLQNDPGEKLPAVVDNRDAERYPTALTASASWRDGLEAFTCHQFRGDEPTGETPGFEGFFSVWFPSFLGEQAIEEHRQHLLVEWSNWIEAAYEDISGGNVKAT